MTDRRPHLLRIHPSLPGRRMGVVPMTSGTSTIGRAADCTVQVEGLGVSTNHARVDIAADGNLLVRDLGSRNGTFVNGWRVQESGALCQPGSLIRVGKLLFIYRLLDSAEAEAADMPPLPGPVDTRHPPLMAAVEGIEEYRKIGGPIWLCGPAGCGRSVLQKHLEQRAEEAVWQLETELSEVVFDFRHSIAVPSDALEARTVHIPPLRSRVEDITILTEDLCDSHSVGFTPRLLEALHLYDWPGNVRELRIMLERAFHPSWGSMPGMDWDLPQFPDIAHFLDQRQQPQGSFIPLPPILDEPSVVPRKLAMDSTALREHMQQHHWQIVPSAHSLAVTRAALVEALAEAGIRGPARLEPGHDSGKAPPGMPGMPGMPGIPRKK